MAAEVAADGGSSREGAQLLPDGLNPLDDNDADARAVDKPVLVDSMVTAGAAGAGQGTGAGGHGHAVRKRGRQRSGWGLVFHSPYFR